MNRLLNWFGLAPNTHIFEFRRGRIVYRRDPLVIRQTLDKLNPDWSQLVKMTAMGAGNSLPESASPEIVTKRQKRVEQDTQILADLVSEAFEITPLTATNQDGFTVAERIWVLTRYLEWCRNVMEITRPFPNSSPATASAVGE